MACDSFSVLAARPRLGGSRIWRKRYKAKGKPVSLSQVWSPSSDGVPMTPSTRYFAALFFAAGMIGIFPLTMRAQNGPVNNRRNEVSYTVLHQTFQRDGRHSESRVFRVSAYCQNSCCCGGSADGITSSGHRITKADSGRICAAPKQYPFGTIFEIPGTGPVRCADRGGAIKAAGERVGTKTLTYDRLDILFGPEGNKTGHQRALEYGVQYLECKVIYAQ
jgi:3D (Asp-Asp-Asp) domain-containing protein